MAQTYLRAVEVQDLPEYPVELCDPDLTRNYFLMFWHRRWRSSKLCLKGSLAVKGAALELYFIAQDQIPVGSLPADHEILALLLRISSGQFADLMAEPVNPLHGWHEYQHNGEVVLGHPVVMEVAFAALEKREARKLSNEDRAVAKRRERLADLMAELGCSRAVCADAALVAWIDDWLLKHHTGQRRRPGVDASVGRGLQAAFSDGGFKLKT